LARKEKIISKILSGSADVDLTFDDLHNLLVSIGFEVRIRGSHHIYRNQGVEEKINLQKYNKKAKPYQVKQIRAIPLKYRFLIEEA
jgi:predicted RNA binding protein YcfA (HicA-like mRNA interferase family)